MVDARRFDKLPECEASTENFMYACVGSQFRNAGREYLPDFPRLMSAIRAMRISSHMFTINR